MKGRVVDPGYLAKAKPVRLECEVCGIKKDCVPCGNHRWCKRGRCPICFPTILHLEQSGKVASAEQQMQVQRKIWDMEFWCETCNQFGKKAPILKDKLEVPEGQRAVSLDLYPGFYMTRDGTLINEAEYKKLTQPVAQQQQRPASAQQQPRPAAVPAQQQKQKGSPAVAAAGGGAVKDKRAAEGGEPAKKRLKMSAPTAAAGAGARPASAQQQQQHKSKAAAAAAAAAGSSSDSEEESDTSSADDEPLQPKQKAAAAASPGKKPAAAPAAAKAPARPAAAAAAAAAGGNAAPAAAKGPWPPDGQAAAGGGSKAGAGAARPGQQPPLQAASKQRGAEPPAAPPAKKPPGAAPAAAAVAAAGKSAGAAAAGGAKEGANKNRPPSPLSAAAAARILQRRSPEGGSSGAGTSSDGVPLTDLASHMQAKKAPAAAGAAAQASRLKPAASGLQQQQQQREGFVPKASADAAGKRPAGAGAAAAAAAGKAKPAPQQQRPGLAPKPSGDAASKQQRQQQQAPAAGKLAQAAAARGAAPAAAGKQDNLRKQQQDRAGAGAGTSKQQQRQAAAASSNSGEESDVESSGSEGDSSEEGSIDKDAEAAIFGPGPSEEADDGAPADKQQQQQRAAKGPQAAGPKQQGGPLANGRAAAAASAAAAAAAAAEAPKPKGPRRKAFSLLDYMRDGAAAAAEASEQQAGGRADGRAAAAEGPGLRAREAPAAAPRAPSSAAWPVKCKVEAAGPNFRYEFVARVKESPSRSGVAVPPLLERQREGTLRCMFWTQDTMLSCVQAEGSSGSGGGAGSSLQFEPVFDEPAPVVLTEFSLLAQHTAHLPSIVRFMVQHKSYMRVWTDSGSLFFGVLLRENGHVADFGSAELQRVRAEHLPDLMVSNELGLVMFKDARQEDTPAAYGKLLPEFERQVTPRTPTWRAAAGASTYDDSWLYDTNLDNFYEQEVIDTVIAQGAHAMNAMNMDAMNMDVDQPSPPSWRQQQWSALSAGVNRRLLAPAAAAAGGGTAQQQQQRRPRMPSRISRGPPPGPDGTAAAAAAAAAGASIPSPDYPVSPPDDAAGPGSDDQQQQQGVAMEVDTRAAVGGQPAQQLQQLDEQQLAALSPLQQLLRGGRPQWPLVPTAETVVGVLRTKGLSGLVVYLEEGCFHDYLGDTQAGQATHNHVERARQLGVTVFAPNDPPEPPAPGTVHIVLVTKAQMERCGLEVSEDGDGITEYLVSGALVVREQFIADVASLPGGSWEDVEVALQPHWKEGRSLLQPLETSFYRTGMFLLLDLSLLLTADMGELHALLLQLHGIRGLMPTDDPAAKPLVEAYCTQADLIKVAEQKHGDEAKWHAVFDEFRRGQGHLCGLLDQRWISNKKEPAGTRMLRNAHKMTYNFNNPKQCGADRTAPLRYTVVVAADPAAAGLSAQQRADVHLLLDNGDKQHKTVIAATLQQARHLLSVLQEQLSVG